MSSKSAYQRITILSAFMQPKAKKFLTTPEVKRILKCPNPDIGSRLWSLAKDGLLLKKALPKSAIAGKTTNQYAITPKGRKLVEAKPHCILSVEDFNESMNNVTHRVKKEANQNHRAYSPTALSAIEGISELIDKNEQYIALIRTINQLTSKALTEFEKQKTQTMPLITDQKGE